MIGASFLNAGTHTVTLEGGTVNAPAYFGAGSDLCVLTQAANTVMNKKLAMDSQQLDFDTSGIAEFDPLPGSGYSALMTNAAGNASNEPIVAMLSGRNYESGSAGDSMWGIFLNGNEPNIDSMSWSINNLYVGAETQSPMFSHALFLTPPSASSIQFIASESPYTGNQMQYKVGTNARLITLTGGMTVYGKALNSNFDYQNDGLYRRFAYVCIGTNGGNPACPPQGTEVVLAQGTVSIPTGHNGVVLFSAKTRVQGDPSDGGGTVYLYIKVDGIVRGSLGIQQISPAPYADSTRTICASYLSTGTQTLSVGTHSVQVIGKASGDFKNLSMNACLPLLWFD